MPAATRPLRPQALEAAQPEMQRAATKGVIHKNTVARKLSRLSARIKELAVGRIAFTAPVPVP